MNKIILLVFCFSGFVSSGQNGFFLQPRIGFGSSIVTAHDNLKLGTYERVDLTSVSVFNCGLGLGYRLYRLEFSSGFSFLQSGYNEHTVSGYMFKLNTKTTQFYNHIALPLMVSYRTTKPGKRFSFVPGFGYEISYNYSDDKIIDQDGAVTKQTLTGDAFKQQYRGASLWAILRFEFDYMLNNGISIAAGPEYHDMLTSMLPSGYNAASYQYSHILSFNAGIIWSPGKKNSIKHKPH